MNGFNPLGGLKESQINGCLIIALFGVISIIYCIIKSIIWIYNHVLINII